MTAERLFSLVERLAAYDGVVAARFYRITEDEKKHNPSGAVADRQGGATEVQSLGAAMADPAVAEWFEVTQA